MSPMNDVDDVDDARLRAALRLAPDPPGAVGPAGAAGATGSATSAAADFPHAIARGAPADNPADEDADWDIATTARHLGVSAHTLRYYERIGLVRVGRSGSGHRRYDAAAVRRLVFLTRMRTSGMPIRDLRRYVDLVEKGEDTVPARLAMLAEHREALRTRIDDLQLALAATDYKIALYSQDMDRIDGGTTGPADAGAANRRPGRGP